MPTLKQIEDTARELSAKQLAVVNDDTRSWSERKPEFDAIEADIKSALDQHAAIKGVRDVDAMFKGGSAAAQGVGPAPESTFKSIGEQLVESDAFRAVMGQKGSRFTSGAIEVKDLSATDPGTPGVYGADRIPGIVDIRFRPRLVRDLLAQGTMSNPAVTYSVETVVVNNAAGVAKGTRKPESSITLEARTEPAKKIATILRTEDEVLDDLAFATAYIDGRLRTFVELEEDDQLLNGSGVGAELLGLLNRSGKAPNGARLSAESLADAIFRQMTKIRTTSFLNVEGLVINPDSWQEIRLSKNGSGDYYAGGPFAPMGSETLWGVPAAVTPAIAVGTSLVGAFRTAAQVLQRKGLTVEVTNTNEDDFVNNKVTFRAEKREALAVYRPGAFGTVATAAVA